MRICINSPLPIFPPNSLVPFSFFSNLWTLMFKHTHKYTHTRAHAYVPMCTHKINPLSSFSVGHICVKGLWLGDLSLEKTHSPSFTNCYSLPIALHVGSLDESKNLELWCHLYLSLFIWAKVCPSCLLFKEPALALLTLCIVFILYFIFPLIFIVSCCLQDLC